MDGAKGKVILPRRRWHYIIIKYCLYIVCMYDLNVLLLDEWTDLGETLDKHCLAHCESHICKYVHVCSLLVLLMYADIRLEDLQVHTNLMAPLNIISKHCLILLAVHANFFRLITAIPSVPSNASALCEVNF